MSGMFDRRTLRAVVSGAAIAGAAGFFAGRSCAPLEERRAAATETCDGRDTGSGAMELIGLIARRSVRQTAAQLRAELGAGASEEARVEFIFAAAPDGSLSLMASGASCRSGPCPLESELPPLIGTIIASDWAIRAGDGRCVMRIGVDIPPVPERPRVFRFPAGRGIDL